MHKSDQVNHACAAFHRRTRSACFPYKREYKVLSRQWDVRAMSPRSAKLQFPIDSEYSNTTPYHQSCVHTSKYVSILLCYHRQVTKRDQFFNFFVFHVPRKSESPPSINVNRQTKRALRNQHSSAEVQTIDNTRKFPPLLRNFSQVS